MTKADIALGTFRWLTVGAPEAIEGVELALEPMGFGARQRFGRSPRVQDASDGSV